MALEYNRGMPVGFEMTFEEFLAWEEAQEEKHEWVEGRVVAFAGGTMRHVEIALELAMRIRPHVKPCHTLTSDMLIGMTNSARYPDVVVTCDDRDKLESRLVRYPKLLVEVLSESTARVDRSEKLEEYMAIETLEEYALVDSRKRWAQVVRRAESGWNLSSPVSGGKLILASIGLEVDLEELYSSVDL